MEENLEEIDRVHDLLEVIFTIVKGKVVEIMLILKL